MVGRTCGRDAGRFGLRPDARLSIATGAHYRGLRPRQHARPGVRLIGQWLAERLGQPFVVEERTGVGSNIATEAVVTASSHGYTLLNVVTANAINATPYEKTGFQFRDIAPVAGLIRFPMVLLVNPSVPAATLSEFIAYAKPIPARSISLRPASERRCMWRPSF